MKTVRDFQPALARVALLLVLAVAQLSTSRFACSQERDPPTSTAPIGDMYHDVLTKLEDVSFDQQTIRQLGDEKYFKVYPGNPVLVPGENGTWDAGAIGSVSVVLVGSVFHMYYEAWSANQSNAEEVDYSTLQIGHALSFDGIHWSKDPANPVLTKGRDSQWDAEGTWDPFVIHADGIFKMWYGGGIHPRCDWGYAESRDGRFFIKHGQVSQLEHVEDDHVVHDTEAGRYYMYYWNRRHEPHGLFRAESKNETDFEFANAVPLTIEGDTDHEMYKFTHVVREGEKWFMLYSDFVRPACEESTTRLAASEDGVRWKSVNRNLFAGHDADVVRANDRLYMAYYGPRGHFDQMNSDVRVAIYAGKLAQLTADNQDQQ